MHSTVLKLSAELGKCGHLVNFDVASARRPLLSKVCVCSPARAF